MPTRPQPAATGDAAESLRITVAEAVLLCLQNNRAFAVERYNPALTRTFEEEQRAAFDPVLSGTASRQWDRQSGAASGFGNLTAASTDVAVSAAERLPTGTSLDLGLSGRVGSSPGGESARLGLTVTQALLRGFGTDANLATLRQARLATLASDYELRGFAQGLVAQTEQAYWDYTLAARQIEIVESSLALARTQLEETTERIRVGQIAEIERAAAEAEVALRRENEIDARSRLAAARLTLLRLTNPPGGSPWRRDVEALDAPALPEQGLDDVEDHVQLALRLRPELNQARLQLQRGDLEVVKTRNGLLPKLDAFVTLGKTGYADSFGGALGDLGGSGYDAQVGLTGEFPWGNRGPRAAQRRAELGRDQATEAVGNLLQLAQVDVRSAHIEAQRLREQVAATAATRRLQEEKLRAETEKFRVGRSTTLLVAQAQRDFLQSQIAEVAAVVNNRKAVVELTLQDGSLLTRLGIAAPGALPVELPAR
ncbi:MAG TPA: TolC family protein [Deferrisomatales bacterium]|nr:TolC family protein [Deferrisomatales bacterium]